MQPKIPALTPVESSQLLAVGFDEAESTLFVQFMPDARNAAGVIYRYFDVPVDVHLALMHAQSKGSYFGKFIKGKRGEQPPYRYERVDAASPLRYMPDVATDAKVACGASSPPAVAAIAASTAWPFPESGKGVAADADHRGVRGVDWDQNDGAKHDPDSNVGVHGGAKLT